MSTDKEAFERWLDSGTADAGSSEQWQNDESLRELYETSLYLQHQADCYEQVEVPEWNRESTYQGREKRQSWLSFLTVSPTLSMALSVVAIVMVLFKVELQVNDDGILLSFGDSSRQKLMSELDERLKDYGRDQQLILANYADDIKQQQKQDIAQLASYLMKSNRQERHEDMVDLVQYLNARRDDDLSLQQQKFTHILYEINQQDTMPSPTKAGYTPVEKSLGNREEKQHE